jgi:hypothetical protein
MHKTLMTAVGASAALVAVAATVPAGATGGTPGGTTHPTGVAFKIVAQGLHNPRQIDFSSTGAMYVAEAGTGGSGPCMPGPEGGPVCFGRTGSVTRVQHGNQHRVLTRLASIGDKTTGGAALGPADLVVLHKHTIILSVGLGTNPAKRKNLPRAGKKQMAHLLWFDLRTGKKKDVGDLGAHEAKTNPIDNRDSDPTGVAQAGKAGFLVTDSGGNTLVSAKNGKVKSVAAFKDRKIKGQPYQSVPTDVVKGPDGAWYVSELTGFPFTPGAARIWRIKPGHKPKVWASGLTNVTSLAFKGHKLYAVQIADLGLADPGGPIGSLRRVFPKSSGKPSVAVASNLFAPYGVAIHKGAAYVSIGGVDPVNGAVIKIPL